MTTAVSAPANESAGGPSKKERTDAAPPPEKEPTKKPKDDKSSGDGKSSEERADARQNESANDEEEKEPAGTRMIATVLARAGEIKVSERALADATVALQINNFSPSTASVLRKEGVGTKTLLRVRQTFVAPHDFASAWAVLADHRLLLLRGSPGDGREHLATFLLDAFCDGRVRRFENGSLADLASTDLTVGGGHLWCGPIGERFDQRIAESLADRLGNLTAYLVVIWPDAVDCPAELSDYAAQAARPDLPEVVRRHLTSTEAKPLLDIDDVAVAVHRLSGARHAAQFARQLDLVASGKKALQDALTDANDLGRGIPDWFNELPEREDKAFALALAALDDLSLSSVVAGARLVDELIQRMEDREGRYGLRPFKRPTSALLTAVDAERVSNFRDTSYGRVPVTAVRLRRRGFAREMLDAFWLSFPYLQEIYLDWMNRLARHQDEYVRERVALAAGLLAAYDFDFIRGRLLLGWAADDDRRLRRAAATALRPAASDDNLREIVWGLLDQWATADRSSAKSRFRRLTAITALGGPVGGGDPVRALDVITRRLLPHVANEDDAELWTDTALAVTELFGDGGKQASDVVLGRAAHWAQTKEVGHSTVAIAVLLGLAGKSVEESVGEGIPMPPLLRATGRTPDNLEHAALLWRLAIAQPKLAGDAMDGLRMMADRVAVADGSGDRLTELVTAIPRTTRDRRALKFAIRRWTENKDNPPPPISERLQEALSLEEDR